LSKKGATFGEEDESWGKKVREEDLASRPWGIRRETLGGDGGG